MADTLLQGATLGDDLPLRNSIVMSFLTRNRCIDDNKPGPAVVEHHATRARDGVGLIIAEGTFVLQTLLPGGKIFYQPWHLGALNSSGDVSEFEKPKEIVEQYRNSARLAKLSGFDGVELLASGGYLMSQFLTSQCNARKDAYSFHPIENRCRFLLEVLATVVEIWGTPRRIGVKICPGDDMNNATASYGELSETYDYLVQELLRRDIAFITLSRRGSEKEVERQRDPRPSGNSLPDGWEPLHQFGPPVKQASGRTSLMVTTEYTVNEASDLIREGRIDFDLVTRIKNNLPFAVNDRGGHIYYGPFQDANGGYNDWPTTVSQKQKS
ncbi:FMN-linked oxidoreductase [Diaporthe amygdali]|uniref:FMN-linked oxidoreductase n=1 Tax=Phomopsis amygdali TaxID=1214568 RepID=UPI0022FE3828|nr:FMN-linked oxidoreductase [Diaporthe amygdali]KAJ0122759.1 FMN-linked oxidoreductase [Diaporthe amygdali]